MSIIVIEDGSIVAGSNSYITIEELDDYAMARGCDIPIEKPERVALIIRAADYTESFRRKFQGTKVSGDQSMQWPRVNVWVDGFTVASDAIPVDLKKAQLQAAIEYIDFDMLPTTEQNIKKEKVDVIEVEYQDGDGSLTAPTFPKVDQYLEALLKRGGFGLLVQPIR